MKIYKTENSKMFLLTFKTDEQKKLTQKGKEEKKTNKPKQKKNNFLPGKMTHMNISLKCPYTNACGMGNTQEELEVCVQTQALICNYRGITGLLACLKCQHEWLHGF